VSLTPPQIRRYARHVLLHDVGGIGQRRLLDAAIAVPDASFGAGAALLYLAAAGVGTLVVGDGGVVTAADVGLVYLPDDVGRPRATALAERLAAMTPDVRVTREGEATHTLRVGGDDPLTALEAGSAAAGALVREIARGATA
jgi:molybdopterin-synthase adenylyltransferase